MPIYFLTGDYDFACTPEMTQRTAEKVKNSEVVIFSGGHFPTSEDPVKFKNVVTPVLNKIVSNDPERRGQRGAIPSRSGSSDPRPSSRDKAAEGRHVVDFS